MDKYQQDKIDAQKRRIARLSGSVHHRTNEAHQQAIELQEALLDLYKMEQGMAGGSGGSPEFPDPDRGTNGDREAPGAEPQPPVVPLPSADPNDFGCDDSVELLKVPFSQTERWLSRHFDGVDPRVDGGVVDGIELYRPDKSSKSDRGLMSGLPDSIDYLTFKNCRTVDLDFWANNGHARGLTYIRCSFLGTISEHDVYVKLCGGGLGLMIGNCYSHGTGSQALQHARREWAMSAEHWNARPGDINVDGWMIVDHARSPAEGGTGTRRSQALKVFSQQAGTKDNQRWEQVACNVWYDRVTLDDSMQGTSMGGFFLGDYKAIKVVRSVFTSGHLESNHTIDHGAGPVEIVDCEFLAKSGESNRGIKLRDLSRPVKIHKCSGNILIVGPDGERLSSISEGFETEAWR